MSWSVLGWKRISRHEAEEGEQSLLELETLLEQQSSLGRADPFVGY